MMEREYYTTPKSTPIMRFLWRAAGGDRYLLERSTYSDHIKYMCLGGIIFATGLMAAIAGGYAFYTIFGTRGSATENDLNIPIMLLSMVFGVLWGLMIFNLDRFIVSSTGTGDGTEAITWDEFKGAIPRIVLGSIIALTISKPVEIRMFKTEIDIKLKERQIEQQTEYQTKVDKTYAERESLIKADYNRIDAERSDLVSRLQKFEILYQEEMTRGQGGRGRGEGPIALSLKAQRDRIQAELDGFDADHKAEVEALRTRETNLRSSKESERNDNEKIANGLDGLLERIKLAHEVAGFWISFFVTMLFLAIELTPIFFKLMLIKSPYDYLKDNVGELIKAEQGIQIEHNYHKDKEGQERDLVIYLNKEKVVLERRELHEAQKRLTQYAISKYEDEMKKRIDANPEQFIRSHEAKSTLA